MHFVEILLGISTFLFIFSIVLIVFMNSSKVISLLANTAIVSIILIALCLLIYICNAVMTCITVWFGNW